jgi:pilus assembly protein HofM
VTAAQRLDIDVLRQLAARLKLRSRPSYRMPARWRIFPWLPSGAGLAWRDDPHWLWATRQAGAVCRALKLSLSQLARCCSAAPAYWR